MTYTIKMDYWPYLNLVNGRLVDDDGHEANINWPSFDSREDAEEYLIDNDIPASLR